ncbi:hypothetical protein ACLBVR_38390, partial [Pseudomonas aeruginosa]|uniref:hypothetical protein n=1 Tax=Pseudomonas aeruginosa TaxID=287 RepID=UPI003968A6F4
RDPHAGADQQPDSPSCSIFRTTEPVKYLLHQVEHLAWPGFGRFLDALEGPVYGYFAVREGDERAIDNKLAFRLTLAPAPA